MKTIYDALVAAVKEAYPDYAGPVIIEQAKDTSYGDYASPVTFAISKLTGESPQSVKQKILGALGRSSDGTPFVNITLTSQEWARMLTDGLAGGDTWGKPVEPLNQKINVEFISANPTGPLTLANGRGGFYGDALANVFTHLGAQVEREYYYNDSGNQIMELGRSVVAARTGEEIEGGYKGEYIQELAHKVSIQDPYKAGQRAAEYIFTHWIKPVLARMGIEFTRFSSEQALIDSNTVEKVLALLKEKDLLYEKDGALWLKTTQFGDDKDRVMRRSDEGETYTYLMKDIAYHWDKIARGADRLFTIVGADHFAEAKTLEAIVRQVLAPAANWEGEFEQPIIQFVRLMKDGQEVKMSKRAGTFVTINDLLDEVNPDVARFFFLMRDLSSHMDFDLNLAKESSDENPVYYVQYAFVRAKHILENASEIPSVIETADLNEQERRLALQIFDLPRLLEEINVSHQVHKLTHYAIELSRAYHGFYSHNPVLKSEGATRAHRLALTTLTFTTLKQVLSLIGVSQPDRMVAEAKAE